MSVTGAADYRFGLCEINQFLPMVMIVCTVYLLADGVIDWIPAHSIPVVRTRNMSMLDPTRIFVLIIINIVMDVQSYKEDDIVPFVHGDTRRQSQTNARQLFYHNIPKRPQPLRPQRPLQPRPQPQRPQPLGNTYKPAQQGSYVGAVRPYQFEYSVSSGRKSGYSRGAASFSHREKGTLPKLVTLGAVLVPIMTRKCLFCPDNGRSP